MEQINFVYLKCKINRKCNLTAYVLARISKANEAFAALLINKDQNIHEWQ